MPDSNDTGGVCEACGAPRGTPHRGWCNADVTTHGLEGTVTIDMTEMGTDNG